MNTLRTIWSIIEKHRFSFIVPMLGVILWVYAAVSCTPLTESPLRMGVKVNAVELQQDFETWQAQNDITTKRFTWAADEIKRQQENFSKVQEVLLTLASGSVTSWGGLLQILVSGGLVGFFADNVRKNGVIGGLKRNKDTTINS